MNSQFVLAMVISGRPVTGLGVTISMTTIGCRGLGCWLPRSVFSGRLGIGVGVVTALSSMTAIGGRRLVSMAESIMVSAISELDSRAVVGTTGTSSTIALCST